MITSSVPRVAASLAITLALTACGGGSDDADDADAAPSSEQADVASDDTEPAADGAEPDDDDDDAAPEPDEPVDDGEAPTEEAPADEPESGGDAPDISEATFEPGAVEYRTVNMLDEPVDLYVITNGLREAWTAESSVAPLAVTDFATPPVDGRYLITTEGAGDPTCVVDCTGHIAELSSGFVEDVFTRTVLLYPDADDGTASAFEIWEDAGPDDAGNSNAMPPADPSTTLVSVSALAVRNPDFGMRLTVDGAEGCITHLAADSRVIGGNQVLTFDTGTATSFTIHGFDDADCAEAPLGGPFAIDPTPGARFHGILHGEGPAVDALVLPMAGNPEGGAVAVDPAVDPAASDEAVGLMTEEVISEFGLDDTTAQCLAELLVDQIGADVLVVDGELVDLDSLSDEVAETAGLALVESIDACGIDPAVFGG